MQRQANILSPSGAFLLNDITFLQDSGGPGTSTSGGTSAAGGGASGTGGDSGAGNDAPGVRDGSPSSGLTGGGDVGEEITPDPSGGLTGGEASGPADSGDQ